jgi:mannitol/fructose-specific phosphotransferase system IIA component (Ntr-type)
MSEQPITDFLLAGLQMRLEAATSEEAVHELVAALPPGPPVRDVAKLLEAALLRESEGCTWLGRGLALPHARTDAVDSLVAAAGLSKAGIPWGPDGERATIVIFAAVPKMQVRAYLDFVRRITMVVRNDTQARALLGAADPNSFRAEWQRAMRA